jgi:pyocin large subunit-like protein
VRTLVALLAAVVLAGCGGSHAAAPPAAPAASPTAAVTAAAPVTTAVEPVVISPIGFRSQAELEQHFAKHGREVGASSIADYLHRAQALRDAPLGDQVAEIIRHDGVRTRFDRRTGGFVAFNRNGVIRTYFRPADGEDYFLRQADR